MYFLSNPADKKIDPKHNLYGRFASTELIRLLLLRLRLKAVSMFYCFNLRYTSGCITNQPGHRMAFLPWYVNRVLACLQCLAIRRVEVTCVTCVGWQVTMCDHIGQRIALCSSEMGPVKSCRQGLPLIWNCRHPYLYPQILRGYPGYPISIDA